MTLEKERNWRWHIGIWLNFKEALPFGFKALKIHRKELGHNSVQRTLGLLEKRPQEQHSQGSVSARRGWLLLLRGKVPQTIPHLETASERLKESSVSKHFGFGYIYKKLGAAYLELH
ncbi:hypothetical protein DITRI_Ditri13aG0101600 [Diplodiscus trichospermus]